MCLLSGKTFTPTPHSPSSPAAKGRGWECPRRNSPSIAGRSLNIWSMKSPGPAPRCSSPRPAANIRRAGNALAWKFPIRNPAAARCAAYSRQQLENAATPLSLILTVDMPGIRLPQCDALLDRLREDRSTLGVMMRRMIDDESGEKAFCFPNVEVRFSGREKPR